MRVNEYKNCKNHTKEYNQSTLFNTLYTMFYQAAITLPISRMKALSSLIDTIETQATAKNMK